MAFKVLYVEDNPVNMRVIRKLLQNTDYHLLEAIDGQSGWALALEATPDLILMDINLPDVSGVALISQMKQHTQLMHIPIVAFTADASDRLKKQCLTLGCVAVLHKPIHRFHLLDVLQRYTTTEATTSIIVNAPPMKACAEMKKVLVVDDNPDLRFIFSRAFDRRYFDVNIASDGVEAIESLQRELPDILILDVNMPRLSGFDVLRYVRTHQQSQDVKVVIVTGNSMAAHSPEAADADLLLLKPVDLNDLITLAQRLSPSYAQL